MIDRSEYADRWRFSWPVLDVLIGGQSSIDLPDLGVYTAADATSFLKSYGYDPADPASLRRLQAVKVEAIAFIEQQLLLPREWNRGIKPPETIIACEDPTLLLLWASDAAPGAQLRRAWSCAILRVMHTIAHIKGLYRAIDLNNAREEIFGRFRRYLHRDEDRRLWLGDGRGKVELSHVEWKEAKSRNSIILKLLHKRDNVAEAIYDYIGMRVITKRLCDVLVVVKLLHDLDIMSFPNAYPSRSRNTLIDVKRFRAQIDTLVDMLTAGSLSPEEFETMLARLSVHPAEEPGHDNPHSASTYRSIQLTGRQLVRLQTQEPAWVAKVKAAAADESLAPQQAQIMREIAQMMTSGGESCHSVESEAFFPFEVQIMDADSYAQVLGGDAAHDRYKMSQVRAARKRVLTKVLELSRQGPG